MDALRLQSMRSRCLWCERYDSAAGCSTIDLCIWIINVIKIQQMYFVRVQFSFKSVVLCMEKATIFPVLDLKMNSIAKVHFSQAVRMFSDKGTVKANTF